MGWPPSQDWSDVPDVVIKLPRLLYTASLRSSAVLGKALCRHLIKLSLRASLTLCSPSENSALHALYDVRYSTDESEEKLTLIGLQKRTVSADIAKKTALLYEKDQVLDSVSDTSP